VFKIKPIPKHMNGNSDAVRIMDLIQLLPENDTVIIVHGERKRQQKHEVNM